MTTDPVCRMEIDEERHALSVDFYGTTYYFCSTGCRELFLGAPERYLNPEATDTVACVACANRVAEGIYRDGRGPYCCERCAFRDRYLGDTLKTIEGPYLAMVEAFVASLDAREHEVGDHSYRVAQFATVLAHQMHITGRPLLSIYCGALLHDLGKIGIPDAILLKEGKLSPEEWEIMRGHPEIGRHILHNVHELAGAVDIVYGHHEHYDGSGYPQGLKGRNIPLGARIFAVCDALDALTVDRPYRAALPFDEAQAIIAEGVCYQYDPVVVAAFIGADDHFRELVDRLVI